MGENVFLVGEDSVEGGGGVTPLRRTNGSWTGALSRCQPGCSTADPNHRLH